MFLGFRFLYQAQGINLGTKASDKRSPTGCGVKEWLHWFTTVINLKSNPF
jgi:hypothetical protein